MKLAANFRRHLNTYKKWWLIGIGVFFFCIIAGTIVGSFYAWRDYNSQYEAWYDQLHQQADRTMALKATTAKEKSKKQEALVELGRRASQATEQCTMYSWLQWQRFINSVSDIIRRCQEKAVSIEAFSQRLTAITAHLEGEAKMAAILRSVSITGNASESTWASTVDKWRQAQGVLQKLPLPQSLISAQKVAIEKVKATHEAWAAVISANEAKDRQKYETAIDQLGSAYAGLGQIAEAGQKSLSSLVNEMNHAYTQTFSGPET